MLLGDESAITLGINLSAYRKLYMILTSLITGTMVAYAGMIGFVGLIIPHITRGIFGADHKRLMLGTLLLGGLFMIWADILSRTLIQNVELPIGIITSVIGSPLFIYMIVKKVTTSEGRTMELVAKEIEVKSAKGNRKNISIHVNKQQFVGLIGPNGCGKSTLLKAFIKA